MAQEQLEQYLVGSGKPAGAAFSVSGDSVSWGDDATPAPAPTPTPAPEQEAVDFGRMTKLQIETFVRDNYGVELDRRHTKGDLIAQALTIRLDHS
tara:strand:+ start:1086 stop:1370 length:285 start_codon:yes stop_codon:yes gene_type:complete